jgi:PST family polysaccharide transporter
VRLALTAIVGIFIARYLGPQGLGLLSFAGGVFGLLGPMALLGMPTILVREFSIHDDWRKTFVSAFSVQVVVALALSILGFLTVVIARDFEREAVLLALVMLPLPVLALHQTPRAYFEATGQVGRVVFIGLAAGVAATAWKVGGLVAQAPVWVFGAAGAIESGLVFLGFLWILPATRRLRSLRNSFRRGVARRLLAESWPLLLAAIAVTIYMKSDLLMLGLIAGDEETGIYAAAARLSEVWYFIPMAAVAAVRPRLARMFASEQHQRYLAATQRLMTALAGLAVLAAASVFVASDMIIQFLYGLDFAPASPVLRVHVLAAPFVFLGVGGNQWFIDRGLTRAVMRRSAIGALLNVAFNLALIPAMGAMGASIATLIAYASGVVINLGPKATRPLFWMQCSAFLGRWPGIQDESEASTKD